MALLSIPDERQAVELARAAHAEAAWRAEVREALAVAGLMVAAIGLELLCFALSFRLSGVWAWRFFYLGAGLAVAPALILVVWRLRKD